MLPSFPAPSPLPGGLARVDRRFGITAEEAHAAVEEAANLWDRALDRPLFTHSPTDGFPILFVYDARDPTARERRRLQEEFDEGSRALNQRRAELAERSDRLAEVRAEHRERRRAFSRRAAAHNGAVQSWNERGGAPTAVLLELVSTEQRLEPERTGLNDRTAELDLLQQELRSDQEGLSQDIDRHNRRGQALDRTFPPAVVESGRYLEAVRVSDGRVASVQRQIQVYQFDDLSHLTLVMAHEFGHTLGLGHDTVPGAVMYKEHDRAGITARPNVQETDVEFLRARCPGL